MTAAGWVFMCGSIAFVIGLLVFCYWRLLRGIAGDRSSAADPIEHTSENVADDTPCKPHIGG